MERAAHWGPFFSSFDLLTHSTPLPVSLPQVPPSLITPAEDLGPDLQAGVILGFVGPQGAGGGGPASGLLAQLLGPPLPGGACCLRLWSSTRPARLVLGDVPLFTGSRWLGTDAEEEEGEEEGEEEDRTATGAAAGPRGGPAAAAAAAAPRPRPSSSCPSTPLLIQVMEAPSAGVLFVLGRPVPGLGGGEDEDGVGGGVGFLTALPLPSGPPPSVTSSPWPAAHARFALADGLALPPPPLSLRVLAEEGLQLVLDGADGTGGGSGALLALPLADRLVFWCVTGDGAPPAGVRARPTKACLWEPFLVEALAPLLRGAPAAADAREMHETPPPPRRRIADYGCAVVYGFGPGGGGPGGSSGTPAGGAVVALVARLEPAGRGHAAPSTTATSPPLDVLLFAAACAASGTPSLISSLLPLAAVPPSSASSSTMGRARDAARLAARAGLVRPSLASVVSVLSNAPALVGEAAASLPALIHPRGPSAVVGWGRGGGGRAPGVGRAA